MSDEVADVAREGDSSGEMADQDEDSDDPTLEELMAQLEADSDMKAFEDLLDKAAGRSGSSKTASASKKDCFGKVGFRHGLHLCTEKSCNLAVCVPFFFGT